MIEVDLIIAMEWSIKNNSTNFTTKDKKNSYYCCSPFLHYSNSIRCDISLHEMKEKYLIGE